MTIGSGPNTDEGHLLLVELTFLHLCIQLVGSQDLQNAPDVLHMLCRVLGEDDDVIEDPHSDDILVFSQDVIHEELKHGRCVCWALGAHLVFEMPLSAPKGCFPFIPLFHLDLVVGITQVNLREHLC